MKTAFKAERIFGESNIEQHAWLAVENGHFIGFITEGQAREKGMQMVDFKDHWILPGLVDSHIHGAVGADTMDATPEALRKIGEFLLREGTTSWQPTTVTASFEDICRAAANVKACREMEGTARIIGCFIEGPYISKEYKGAHPEDLIRPLTRNEVEKLQAEGLVNVFAVAPELEGAAEFIHWAVERGIRISLAHSAATYDEACAGLEAGADAVVHTYCGMAPLHHRSPNLLGAALTQDALYAELIADGIHVQVPAMQVLLRCKPKDKLILVSDAIQATGLPDGEYMLGVEPITVKDGISRVRNGSLAGSTATLLQEVRRLIAEAGEDPLTAVQMASLNPSRRLGLDREIGSIAAGKKADFIVVDRAYQLKQTWLEGRKVVDRKTEEAVK